jgi:hypothetical protein
MINILFIFLGLYVFNLPFEYNNYQRTELERNSIILNGRWTDLEVGYVYSAIVRTGYRIMEYTEVDINNNPIEIFAYTYNIKSSSPFIIDHYNNGGVGGIAYSYRHNGFHGFYRNTTFDIHQQSINLVIHEIGHSFEFLIEKDAYTRELIPFAVLMKEQSRNWNFPRRTFANSYVGYCGLRWVWQQSPSLHPREEFADMFIGWVYNCWEDSEAGELRKAFMDKNMKMWLFDVIGIKRPFYQYFSCDLRHCMY